MLLTLLCNFAPMAIWAALFMFLGESSDFATALYHSAANFITLGYGEFVMSRQRRMPGRIEAANGILMFVVSTSVMTAAVMDVTKYHHAPLQQESPRKHARARRRDARLGHTLALRGSGRAVA
ncbi:ion channel [Paraburkholderia flagellata]|uniref:ion channel n=1 Tax=Paraburkholderia flagellata TaxID=2883241 RepID=UPI0027E58E0A|nr:ion channel [Paraburkholderia flagellata]